jgi:hypothetical protein
MLMLCRYLRLDTDRSYRKDSLGKKALGILKLNNMFQNNIQIESLLRAIIHS